MDYSENDPEPLNDSLLHLAWENSSSQRVTDPRLSRIVTFQVIVQKVREGLSCKFRDRVLYLYACAIK